MISTAAYQSQPLLKELRWFVHLRWLAGLTIITVVIGSGFLLGWDQHYSWAIILGSGVLAYNIPLWVMSRKTQQHDVSHSRLIAIGWVQVVLDLACLTGATLLTGGLDSPFRGFFVLHMVLSSLVLGSPSSFLAALIATLMLLGGLGMTGQWPATRPEALSLMGWIAMLPLTVFLTTHIVRNLRWQETRVADQNERLRSILDTAADGIITINDQGIIESTNPAVSRTFGYHEGELIGHNIKLLMPEPYHGEHDTYLANFLHTRTPKIIGIGREVVGLRKNGTTFPLDLAVSEVSLHGRTLFTGILRDISQRKIAEQELQSLNQRLQQHQKAMIQQEKMAAMGQLAAGIVHEISNPLASLDSLLQLVRRYPDRLKDQTHIELQEQVARIHRITRQLTDFAHPNETALERRSVNEIVEGALEMVRFDHRIRHVQVKKQFDMKARDVCISVHSFQQVLLNIILNALDAMASVATPVLKIATATKGEWTVIEITDNGHGIAPEHVPHVFEPFFTTKPLGKGTGLGLSISYNLIQRHGGRCEVESETGANVGDRSGTTFRILLPTC